MDPISITAACVGLLSGLTTVSTKLRSLTADAKNANKEITALQNELDSCQRSLGLFYGSGDADRYPEEMKADLEKIIRECRNVVIEIDRTLDKVTGPTVSLRQSVQWSMTTRDEILRLHRNLEGHKSALSIAIAFASMSINRGIKSDTSSIRSKAARIPDMQNQLAAILQALQVSDEEDPEKRELGVAMQRFLQESYAQSVIDTNLTRSNTVRSYATSSYDDNPFRDHDTASITYAESSAREPDEAYFSGSTGTPSEVLSTASLSRPFSNNDPLEISKGRSDSFTPLQHVKSEPIRRKPVPSRSFTPSITAGSSMSIAESDNISITSSQQPLTKKGFWKRRASSKPELSTNPADMPILEGRITQRNLEKVSALLLRDPVEFAKDPSYHEYKVRADSIYQRTLRVAPSINNSHTDRQFQQAVRIHQSGEIDIATTQAKELAEIGHISSQIMYALALRYGRGCRVDAKLALAYLYCAARVAIELEINAHPEGPWFENDAKADELRLVLFEIASTFRYTWADSVSARDARSFYAAAADIGDRKAMRELAWCYRKGYGIEKDKILAVSLAGRAELMR